MDRFGKWNAALIILSAAVYLLFFSLFDYQKNWVQPEIPQYLYPLAVESGTALKGEDFVRSFDYRRFDNNPQPRFLSHYFLILNVKFRLWLYQTWTPHPTFSVTWLLILFLSPVLFYLFLSRWLGDPTLALWGATLYLFSTGFLSGLNMNFHPAKPLTNLGLLAVAALGAFARSHLGPDGRLGRRGWFYFGAMLSMATICLFFDVTGIFAWAIVVLLFSELFFAKPYGLKRVPSALLAAAVGLQAAVLFAGLPRLTRHLGYGDFNFWKYAITTNGELKMSVDMFFGQLLVKGASLIRSHLVPPIDPYLQFLLLCVAPLAIAYSFSRLPSESKKLFLRLAGLTTIFIVFEVLILTRHPFWFFSPKVSGYYYGAPFSIFYVALAVLMLQGLGKGRKRQAVFLGYFAVCLVLNHEYNNREWFAMHRAFNSELQTSFIGHDLSTRASDMPTSYEFVRDFWHDRERSFSPARSSLSRFPKDAPWIWREASFFGNSAKR